MEITSSKVVSAVSLTTHLNIKLVTLSLSLSHLSFIDLSFFFFRFLDQGVVIFTMSDIPIGFGVTAKSTQQCRKVEGTGIVVYHQADVGEYLREEGHLT